MRPPAVLRSAAMLGLLPIAAIAALRGLVLAGSTPSGIDGGNWLAFGTFARQGVVYPPLVPDAFAGLVRAVGVASATTAAAMIASSLPAVAVLGVAAWAGRSASAVLAATLVAGSGAIGQLVAWGGYPQPLADAAAVVALVALARYAEGGGGRPLGAAALASAGVVGTSGLEAVPMVAAAALIVLWAVADGRPRALRRGTAALLAVLVPAAALAPTYGAMLATLGIPPASSADAGWVLGPAWAAYALLLVAVLAASLLRRARPAGAEAPQGRADRALLVAAAAAAVAWGAAFLVSGEPRLLYDLATLGPLCAVALVPVVRPMVGGARWRRVSVAVAGVAVCAAVTASGLAAFPGQVAYYRVMTPGELAALAWLGEQRLGPEQLLVADRAGVPLGWWAEGLTGREALYASDLRWLRFESERARAVTANALLYRSGFPYGSSASDLFGAGVRFVLLPAPSALGVDSSNLPPRWRIAYANGGTLVLAPQPPAQGTARAGASPPTTAAATGASR